MEFSKDRNSGDGDDWGTWKSLVFEGLAGKTEGPRLSRRFNIVSRALTDTYLEVQGAGAVSLLHTVLWVPQVTSDTLGGASSAGHSRYRLKHFFFQSILQC
jgi:hypothetical protein